jgi:hypothetical protein
MYRLVHLITGQDRHELRAARSIEIDETGNQSDIVSGGESRFGDGVTHFS